MHMNTVEIKRAYVSTISISGKKESAKVKFVNIKQKAHQYGGRILREQEFTDGFFVEVQFADEGLMNVWENAIGVK